MQLNMLSQQGGVLRAEVEGKICQSELSPGADLFRNLIGDDAYNWKILLSMEKADFVDSLGVAWLLQCHKRFRDAGGQLILHSVPPMISQVLRVLQLNKVFTIGEDERAAQTLASGGAA